MASTCHRTAVILVMLCLSGYLSAQKSVNPNFETHRLDYRNIGYPADWAGIDIRLCLSRRHLVGQPAFGDVHVAVNAMKEGANDFIH